MINMLKLILQCLSQ